MASLRARQPRLLVGAVLPSYVLRACSFSRSAFAHGATDAGDKEGLPAGLVNLNFGQCIVHVRLDLRSDVRVD